MDGLVGITKCEHKTFLFRELRNGTRVFLYVPILSYGLE